VGVGQRPDGKGADDVTASADAHAQDARSGLQEGVGGGGQCFG
jgi:hypothetical protein